MNPYEAYKDNKNNYFLLLNLFCNKIGGANKIKPKETITEKALWKYVEKNTKSSQQATFDDEGKLINNVANYGLQNGQIAVRGGGEYNGFSIKALEDIKPILTSDRIARAIRHLLSGDVQKSIGVLRLTDEVYQYGLGIIYGVLKVWLESNDIPVPSEYSKKAVAIHSKKFLRWIHAFNWAPIDAKFEIVDIGHGKNYSVVPENWLGRIFNDADELHEAMDKLEWRKGKPPVNFCAIYAMRIKETKVWETINEVKDINVKIGIIIDFKNKLTTKIKIFQSKKEYANWIKNLPEDSNCLSLDLNTEDSNQKLIIVCRPEDILEKKPVYIKKRNVGLLVSTMQKLVRRGPTCSKALYDVLLDLWRSPGYNLPEQQFLRVNACRQLAWRLFIMSIEDVQAFITDDERLLSMIDLAALAIVANGFPDLQFNEKIFDKLVLTALSIQRINTKWDLLKNAEYLQDEIPLQDTNDDLLNAFTALTYYMPTREWDNLLMKFSYNYISKEMFKPTKLNNIGLDQFLEKSIQKDSDDGLLAGMDMHPYPNILILLQASLPFLPYDTELHTTKKLWNFIWTTSSGVNFRVKKSFESNETTMKLLKILKGIQYSLLYPKNNEDDENIENSVNTVDTIDDKFKLELKQNKTSKKTSGIPNLVKRTAFILLFGEKRTHIYKKKHYQIIIAGCDPKDNEYCKVKVVYKNESKYLEGELRKEIEFDFFKNFSEDIEAPNAPSGYLWTWQNNKRKINIKTEFNEDKILFYVDNIEIEPYDATNILIQLEQIIPLKIPAIIKTIIEQALYMKEATEYDDYSINLLMRDLHSLNYPLFEWVNIAKKSNLPSTVWKSVYTKLYNNKNNEIQIGPVDGRGHSLRDSISYLYEGTLWRIFNMLSMIYPKVIIVTRAAKSLKFDINQNTSDYIDLIEKLQELSFNANEDVEIIPEKLEITTKLWDHQKKTVDKILSDVTLLKRRGFGDSSDVGSGKTLTALAVMAGLYNMNIDQKIRTHSGFLVLLPTTYLYNTWKDEINKHCRGFHMIFQNADGSLTSKNQEFEQDTIQIQTNTILVTTLGRMRDHPLVYSWIFVMIDECLSVQNKSALQTEEAWKQIITSQYGVLLASATFFRTRFDKLFYMIKMLNSGLPENKSYLDAILAESIISNIPNKIRDWKMNYNPFHLSKKMREDYDLLLEKDITSERLYIKLQSFLFDNFDYVAAFQKVLDKCEKENRRCLIYTRSKDEADVFAKELTGTSRFPDITGNHLAISYTEGTYGLNNLVYLDTIVTRFPEPDKLPQMKGRLDRPNQKENTLYIEYIYVDDTIDRAGKLRLEMANSYYNNYILPLAEFYDIAVKRRNID
jgi:superfamily II DNA or RNA helicase